MVALGQLPEINSQPGTCRSGEERLVRQRVTDRLRGEVVRLYESGQSSRRVADEVNLARSTVLKILKQQGVVIRPPGTRY